MSKTITLILIMESITTLKMIKIRMKKLRKAKAVLQVPKIHLRKVSKKLNSAVTMKRLISRLKMRMTEK